MKSVRLLFVISILIVSGLSAWAVPPLGRINQPSSNGSLILDYEEYINSNNILAFVTNQGMMFRDLSGLFGHDYGCFYPYTTTAAIQNGSNTSAVMYSAGLWMFGVANGQLSGAVAQYSSEFLPGPMSGTTFVLDSLQSPRNRVYKLYIDSMADNPNSDYLQWPVDQGAPVDMQGRPVILGSQMLYSVYNNALHTQPFINEAGNIPPLGVEVHQTVWAYGRTATDTLFSPNSYSVTPLNGGSELVEAVVEDPYAITGHDYMVEVVPFDADSAIWRLIDRTLGVTVLDNQSNFTGDESAPVVDGIRIQVKALGIRFSSFQAVANAAGPIDPPEPAAFGPLGFPTPGLGAPTYEQQTTGQRWLIHTADNGGSSGGGTRGTYEAFLARTTRSGSNWPEIIKGNYEFRFTGAGNYGIVESDFGYQQDYLIEVPFEVWDIGKNTTGDSSDDTRLIPILLENDDDSTFNLSAYGPGNEHSVSGADNDPFTDWIYLMRPPNPIPGEQAYDNAVATVQAGGDFDRTACKEILARLVFVAWNAGEAPPFDYPMPENGTVFQMLTAEGFTTVDSFSFTATIPQFQSAGGDGNALYVKYDLFNKGGRDIQGMYLSIWGDPDIGDYRDDLIACDTVRQIYYAYNSTNSDSIFGVRCPAVGFTVLQGPTVPAPGQVAVSFGKVIPNRRNMNVTTFNRFVNGTDPNDFNETYNYMCGLNSDGSPSANGTKYMVPGDPIALIGDLDFAPSDRRMMGSIGPIHMAPGDSQQVIIKWGVGQGLDRLNSIVKLRQLLAKKSDLTTTDDSLVFTSSDNVIPEPQSIILQNNVATPFAWQAATSSTWLSLDKTLGCVSPDTLVVAPNRILAPGTYHDSVTIVCYDNVGGPTIIPVTYQVLASTCCTGTTGNVDNVGIVNLTDLSLLIAYLTMTPRPTLPCEAEANVNSRSGIDLSDLALLIGYLTLSLSPELPACPSGAH